jgi:hypothetical protein
VSSVLKALKKLEQAPAGTPTGPMSPGAATVIIARDTPSGWLQRWGWALGLGLAVGLTVLGADLLRAPPPPPTASPVPLVQPIGAGANPAASPDRSPPAAPGLDASLAPSPTRAAAPVAAVRPPAPTAAPRPSPAVDTAQDAAVAPEPAPVAAAVRDDAVAAAPPTGGTAEAADPADDDRLPRLTDERVALQAIAWSDVAERRMAVINGDILREGGAVAGFTVRRIRRDDVLVATQGRTWRLVFRNRE